MPIISAGSTTRVGEGMHRSVKEYREWRPAIAEALACTIDTIPDADEAVAPKGFDESKR